MFLLCALLSLPADAAPTEVAAREGANLQRPRWSADGRGLAWEANDHERKAVELYVGDPDKRSFSPVRTGSAASSSLTAGFAKASGAGVRHELSWGPPGAGAFVFSAAPDGVDYDLYIGTGASSAPIAVSSHADGGPAWSPDGKHIAFTSARTGQGDVYLLNTAAVEGAPRRLSTDPESSEVDIAWSSDSQQLAWVGHTRQGDNLWLAGLQGAPAPLTRWTGSQTRPRFSPTKPVIAFYANHDAPDRFDLWVVDAKPGAEPRKLLDGVVPNAGGPVWLPDGDALLVVRDDDAAFDPMVRVPLAGAATRVDLGTVGHGDLDVVRRADGKVWVAWVAQGRVGDATRDFDRLFVAPLP